MFIVEKAETEQSCSKCMFHNSPRGCDTDTSLCKGGWMGYFSKGSSSKEVDDYFEPTIWESDLVKELTMKLEQPTAVPEPACEKKYDQGKPMVGQMKKDFAKALLAIADVTRYGIEKYKKPGSWKEVTDALDRYEDALGRHDLQGTYEERDAESTRRHAVHRAWNALATLQLILEADEHEDNRVR